MKKVLFGLLALSSIAMASETNLYLRAGGDFLGEYEVVSENSIKANSDEVDNFSWEIALEATREVYSNFELGLGLAYQKHGDAKSAFNHEEYGIGEYDDTTLEMPGYTSIPLYLVAKYNFNAINNFVPYVKAHLGYSFNNDDGNLKGYGTIVEPNNPIDKWFDEAKVKIDDGLYYGLGAGFEYNNFTMDLMYQVNLAEAEIDLVSEKIKKDYDYSRVTLSFGYKFDF